MSWILQILAVLSQLQSSALVQAIEQCVLTNNTAQGIWTCVLSKLQGHAGTLSVADSARVDAAKSLAQTAGF